MCHSPSTFLPRESSLSFLAGPICGFFVQPIVGALSDRCSLKWGRRRPFITFGAVVTSLSLVFLCFSYTYGAILHGKNPIPIASVSAMIGLILLNTTINIMLAPVRSIIQDIVPKEALDKGNAFSALMLGAAFFLCNLIFFLLLTVFRIQPADHSFIYLLEVMGVVGAVVILITLIPTLIIGREASLAEVQQDIESNGEEIPEPKFFLIELVATLIAMPNRLRIVCVVFFFSWAGYFPIQIFTTSIFSIKIATFAVAISSLAGALWTFPLSWLCAKFGEKWPYFITQTLSSISTVGMIFVGLFSDYKLIYIPGLLILMVLIQINVTTANSAPFSLIGKEQSKSAGAYVGVMNAFCVLAQAFVNIVIAVIALPFSLIPSLSRNVVLATVHQYLPLVCAATFGFIGSVCCLFLQTKSVADMMNDDKPTIVNAVEDDLERLINAEEDDVDEDDLFIR